MPRTVLPVLITLAITGQAYAHHGTNSQFDQSKSIEVAGVVTEIAFINPHSYVYFDVTDENGETRSWHCELRAATALNRSGWTEEMFTPGTRISITGAPSRMEENGCYIASMTLNDSLELERYEQIEANKAEVDTARPLRLANGQPNISGDWATEQRLGGPEGMGMGAEMAPGMGEGMAMGPGMGAPMGPGGAGIVLTEAGQEALARLENSGVDRRLGCLPRSFIQDMILDQHPNRIVQEDNKITLRYGFMDTTRVIHLGVDSHPDNIEPSFAGHSIGRWEGDVLVVDTIGFESKAYRGSVNSEAYHVVERFSLEDNGKMLKREHTEEDPLYWTGTQSGEQVLNPADYTWEPYACDDRAVE
jgi:hypothetical protein